MTARAQPDVWILTAKNRQRLKRLDTQAFVRHLRYFLQRAIQPATVQLGITFVGRTTMAKLNHLYLNHTGSTDVITFDYGSKPDHVEGPVLHGELFISVADAIDFARDYRTTWQHELVRYGVHGCLHLSGYNDVDVVKRRKMKDMENRWMRLLEKKFDLTLLGHE